MRKYACMQLSTRAAPEGLCSRAFIQTAVFGIGDQLVVFHGEVPGGGGDRLVQMDGSLAAHQDRFAIRGYFLRQRFWVVGRRVCRIGIAVVVVGLDAFIQPRVAAFVRAEDGVEPVVAHLMFNGQVQLLVRALGDMDRGDGGIFDDRLRRLAGPGRR